MPVNPGQKANGAASAARVERDPLGEVRVPAEAYWGAQTQRAVENFPISGITAPADLVTATVLIKQAAARANGELGRLERRVADAIVAAADDILNGRYPNQFVVDVYQAGAGTSHNMNANEVLANVAAERLGEPRGSYKTVHPNDHVNMGQSTNDVFPAATRLAILLGLPALLEAAFGLADALDAKAREFAHVLKTGRTHLQDAVPITLGQEFGGFAANVRHAAEELKRGADSLHELNLGATAVGTGLNAGDDFTKNTVSGLAATDGPAVAAGLEPVSGYAEHGRRARVLRRTSTACRGGWQSRVGSAPPEHGASRRPCRGSAAASAARVVDHAGQGQPVDPRDGQPGLLPGHRL